MKLLLVIVLASWLATGCTGLMLGGSSGGSYPSAGNGLSGPERADDARISAAVRSSLSGSPSLAGSRISVVTHAGRVTLNGTVASYAERQRAADLASRVADVVSVDNQLRVAR